MSDLIRVASIFGIINVRNGDIISFKIVKKNTFHSDFFVLYIRKFHNSKRTFPDISLKILPYFCVPMQVKNVNDEIEVPNNDIVSTLKTIKLTCWILNIGSSIVYHFAIKNIILIEDFDFMSFESFFRDILCFGLLNIFKYWPKKIMIMQLLLIFLLWRSIRLNGIISLCRLKEWPYRLMGKRLIERIWHEFNIALYWSRTGYYLINSNIPFYDMSFNETIILPFSFQECVTL